MSEAESSILNTAALLELRRQDKSPAITVRVVLLERRMFMGNPQYRVAPVAGSGSIWVDRRSLIFNTQERH